MEGGVRTIAPKMEFVPLYPPFLPVTADWSGFEKPGSNGSIAA